MQAEHGFALFGSALAAVWLHSYVWEHVTHFVDEDPGRIGASINGLPILAPDQLPPKSTIFICLSPHEAKRLFRRYAASDYHWIMPPAWS